MKQEMDERGQYRPIFSRLWDDPDFRKLSTETKLIFLYLRTCNDCHRAAIYKFSFENCEDATGFDKDIILNSIQILSKTDPPWIEIEGKIIWIRKGLHFDPSFNPNNENHLKAIKTQLYNLPKSQIVKNFLDFYHFPIPYSYTMPDTTKDTISDTIRDQVIGIGKREEELGIRESDKGKRKEGVQRKPSREPIQHPVSTNSAPKVNPLSLSKNELQDPKTPKSHGARPDQKKHEWLLKEQANYLKEHGNKDFERMNWEKYTADYYQGGQEAPGATPE